MIKGILENVHRGTHRARFSELALSTPEMRNRKKLGEYLKFLVEIGWLERRGEQRESPYNLTSRRASREWVESWYYLTEKGETLLSLFPEAKGSVIKRPGLFAIKAILEKAEGGVFSFSTLAKLITGARNRKNLLIYLNFLCDELGWLERREVVWTKLRLYDVTEKGRSFLDLFPKDSG